MVLNLNRKKRQVFSSILLWPEFYRKVGETSRPYQHFTKLWRDKRGVSQKAWTVYLYWRSHENTKTTRKILLLQKYSKVVTFVNFFLDVLGSLREFLLTHTKVEGFLFQLRPPLRNSKKQLGESPPKDQKKMKNMSSTQSSSFSDSMLSVELAVETPPRCCLLMGVTVRWLEILRPKLRLVEVNDWVKHEAPPFCPFKTQKSTPYRFEISESSTVDGFLPDDF